MLSFGPSPCDLPGQVHESSRGKLKEACDFATVINILEIKSGFYFASVIQHIID